MRIIAVSGKVGAGKSTVIGSSFPSDVVVRMGVELKKRGYSIDGNISDPNNTIKVVKEILATWDKDIIVFDGSPRTKEELEFFKTLPNITFYTIDAPDIVCRHRINLRKKPEDQVINRLKFDLSFMNNATRIIINNNKQDFIPKIELNYE